MKLLTVAIPTYNGALTISKSILSILKCFDYCDLDEVELIISDNDSTDNTASIVNSIIDNNKKYGIKYYKNSINSGADSNFDLSVKRASGKYVWLFSDSEKIINEKAIYHILEVLRQKEYDFLMVNYENDIKLGNVSSYYDNGDDFFQNTKFKSNFITSCIVNKQEWIDLHLENYYGSYWIQTAYQIKALSPLKKCCAGLIKDVYIASLNSKAKWGNKGSFILVGLNLLKVYIEMKELGYNKTTLYSSCDIVKGGYPINICFARVRGLKLDKFQIDEFKTSCEALGNPLGFINTFFMSCPVVFCYIYILIYKAMRLFSKIIDKLNCLF